jgi:hypothetical protein
MSDLRLGKLAAKRPYGLKDLATYANGPLPPPPPSVEVPYVPNWQMFANGPDPSCTVPGAPFGDCVIAGAAHVIIASNVEVQREDAVPSSNAVAEQYLAITGGQDTGCNESDVLSQWRNQGLFGGNRISAYCPVETDQLGHVHSAVSMYGMCFLGVQVPESAQEQFSDGQPWTVVPNSPIMGGHCIVIVGYDSNYLYAVTWGGIAPLSYPWFSRFCDEAWCLITEEVAEAGDGPSGLNLAALQKDLDAISD